MSASARRERRKEAGRCACGRPAVVKRGEGHRTRAGFIPEHPLCSRCYRDERQSYYAKLRKDHPPRGVGDLFRCSACGSTFERATPSLRCPCGAHLDREWAA